MGKPQSSKKDRRSVREESRAVYRQAIMDAALRVFGQTGFRDAKITDIASEAGVATGTLYNYFSSKDDIFQSILLDGRDRLRAQLERQTAVEDPLERLRELARAMFAFLEEHGVLFTVYMQTTPNPFDPANQRGLGADFHREILAMIEGALVEAGDRLRQDHPISTLSMAFGGLVNGVILRWIEQGCSAGLADQADTIMDFFTNGAGSQ